MKLNFKFKLWKDVVQTLSIQSRLGTRKHLFYLAVISSSIVTYAQLQMIVFLNPLLKGIISADFSEVRQMTLFQVVEELWGQPIVGNGKLLIFVSLCVYFITLVRAGSQYLASVSMGRYSHQIAKSLRHFIFQRYLDFGKAYFDRRNVGELISIMSGSVKSFSNQMNQLQGMLIASFLVLLYFGFLLKISWRMTLIVCLVVPLFNRANRRLAGKIRELAKSRVTAEKKFGAKLNEVLNGLVIVKGFNKELAEVEVFKENSDRELNLHWSTLRWEALLGPVHEVSSTTTFLFIAFALSTLGVIDHIGAASLFIYFYVVQQFIPAFGKLQQHQIEFDKSTDWNDELREIFDDLEKHKVPEGGLQIEHFKKEIQVQNLTFSYLDNKPVINDLTCKFPIGKDIALVGPTGSGKSTLLNLLLRLYDCPAGSIFLDGFDIRDYQIASIRNKMAFVSQDVFLFDASVMYNLTYGLQGKVSVERVMEVSHQTMVHEFVKSLPDGYDSFVGERGCKLSGGQRQRIALARALLREAEIILLDEPTSALDVRTESEVVESVKKRLKGKTVITIAHRLSTIQNADFIIFLDKGTIKGQGKFVDLVSSNRSFADFVGTTFKKAS